MIYLKPFLQFSGAAQRIQVVAHLACCLFFFPLSAQHIISGTLLSGDDGQPLIGATIRIDGSDRGTISDLSGHFSLEVPNLETILFLSYIGFETKRIPLAGRTSIEVFLRPLINELDSVVVTGYVSQRKGDITGAVSVLDVPEMQSYQAASFVQKLEGRAAGLRLFTSGAPGAPSYLRIRGISSFTDNTPLIVIDGVPVLSNDLNWLNPQDIESIQVLKDASAASIYGSRANNGVLIVTTKQGKAGRTTVSYHGYAGVQTPVGYYDDFMILDPQEYGEYYWQRHLNAGLTPDHEIYGSGPEPVLPAYLWPEEARLSGTIDESTYAYPENNIIRTNRAGTNWYDEVIDPALITEHQLRVSGGGDNGVFSISGAYLKQDGTLKYTGFERYSVRANTRLKARAFTFGENIAISYSRKVNQNSNLAVGFNELYYPVYDIGGHFAESNDFQNPLANLYRGKDNDRTSFNVLGNVYAGVDLFDLLDIKTSLGLNYGQTDFLNFYLPPPVCTNCTDSYLEESWSRRMGLTWTNTLNFARELGRHTVNALVGYETIYGRNRAISGSLNNYFVTNLDSRYLNPGLADPATRQVESSGDILKIASLFGKLDYSFDEKYLFSFTLRYDGSSNFGNNKYGTFPAVNFGWRVSAEPFMEGIQWLTDLKFRIGLGTTGGQNIPAGNAFDRFGGSPGTTFYDIFGTNFSAVTGYALTRRGNADTRWERNRSLNIGMDLSTWQGRFSVVVDAYNRITDGLLFNPVLPGTGGFTEAPFVNIGEMRNTGIDLVATYKGRISRDWRYEVGVNASHYRNEIRKVSGDTDSFFGDLILRTGISNINKVGYPISSFYGYFVDGIFQDQAEVDAHAAQNTKTVGRLRFRDLNEDGIVNDEDKDITGHPHPDLLLGLNLNLSYRNLDLSALLFASLGNEIYNYNRWYFEFGNFGSNVTKAAFRDSWRPDNRGARIPIPYEGDPFSSSSSTYYVEDGSYLRLKIFQLGYTLPGTVLQKLSLDRLRIYLQAQNLFTITRYSGIDPALSIEESLGDIYTGYDYFGVQYPASKVISAGMNIAF